MADHNLEGPSKPTVNDQIASMSSLIAIVLGIAMISAGAILAAVGRAEAALVWTGTVVVAFAVFGDRLRSLEFGREGGKITLAEKKEALKRSLLSHAPNATEIPAPPPPASATAKQREVLDRLQVIGPYWSQPALDTIVDALGSNTRQEFGKALADLQNQVTLGTAVVKIADTPDQMRQRQRGSRPSD
jgi:hypothetical protein